ncbi:potassium transporter [Parabacteroides faecis]|uniref:TrkH family potassium uptake protein n=1 Tax=Parabacteroides faecis TaxID=1217282 RepID=UPI002164B0FC|nr:potassium transporter TrkG [Parabacteroides faecis]MCS2893912.1 potassium transporter [Parabacteroides faecis]UVQ47503.1 potassium transporter [Parabacteroides faecis]
MDIKHIQFTCRMYWANAKGLLNIAAEGIILLASIASLFVLVYQFGFQQTNETIHHLYLSRIYILLGFFIGITLRYIVRFNEIIQEKLLYLDIGIYFLLFAVLSAKVFFRDVIERSLPYLDFLSKPLFVYTLMLLLSVIHLSRQTFTLMQTRIKPSLLFLLSFIFVILIGAGLLMLPNATTRPIHFVDALFTATTSVCVTGLTTVDVATTFTHIGHVIIMILIQIGGIGVMTFTSFFALSFMGHSSFTSKLMLKDMLNEERTGGLFRVILNILFVTFFIEGIGAYFIYMDIRGTLPGATVQDDIFFAIFHAVSAFCNAGISTLSGNMCDPLVVHNYNLHVWISLLIIFGGLGFPIVFNYLKLLRHFIVNTFMVATRLQKRYIHTPRIINIHTYIVVISTLALIIGGMILYFIFETDNTLAGLPLKGKLADSLLGAVTPRTAGFTVADMGTLRPVTLMLTLILMVIGAAPMSTGGGLKVTTVFVAIITALNVAREKEKVEVRKREISPATIRRAFATIVLYFIFASVAVWMLSYTEEGTPIFTLTFEVVSALSTVGSSLNFSPLLSMAGKLIIICTMLIGRIGVLTFMVSFIKEYKKRDYTYPQENILM